MTPFEFALQSRKNYLQTYHKPKTKKPMTKNKHNIAHSRGPWRHDPIYGLIYADYGQVEVCAVHSGTKPGQRAQPEIAQANARLIAAAPELLEACKALHKKARWINDWQHSGNDIAPEDWSELNDCLSDSRTIIAKAEGAQ